MAFSNRSNRFNRSNRLRQRGQGMSEYLIIVALIAIGAIGVIGGFGDVVQGQVSQMAQELSGQDSDGSIIEQGRQSAQNAATQKNLGNYATANGQ